MIAIVVVAWSHLDTTTAPCLRAVRSFTDVPYRVLVVDNASTDDTRAHVAALAALDPRISLLQQERNLGWAGGVLAALERLTPEDELLCLLNSDTIVTPLWLSGLARHLARRPDVTAVLPDEAPELGPRPVSWLRALARRLAAARDVTARTFEPGSAPPAPTRPFAAVLATAGRVRLRRDGATRPTAPSGFCLLLRRSGEPLLRAYLRDFEGYRSGALDWRELWRAHGGEALLALDTHVFHARGGSGGYYAYADRGRRSRRRSREKRRAAGAQASSGSASSE